MLRDTGLICPASHGRGPCVWNSDVWPKKWGLSDRANVGRVRVKVRTMTRTRADTTIWLWFPEARPSLQKGFRGTLSPE